MSSEGGTLRFLYIMGKNTDNLPAIAGQKDPSISANKMNVLLTGLTRAFSLFMFTCIQTHIRAMYVLFILEARNDLEKSK